MDIKNYISEELYSIDINNITDSDFLTIFQWFANSYYWINYNSDKSLKIRHLDLKWYFLDFNQSWYLHVWYEILLLKMFKIWLLDIVLFDFTHDIKSKDWEDFYIFMDKYSLKSDIFRSNETWEVEYDLRKIVNNEYEKFIKHIFNNITYLWDEEDFDFNIVFWNRLYIDSEIENIWDFFNKVHYLMNKNENSDLLDELIDKLNNWNWIIEYELNVYVNEKSFIYFYIKYLESKWKININSIEIYNNSIKYNMELIVYSYHELMFLNFSFNNIYEMKSSFVNDTLDINWLKININKIWKWENTQLWEVLDLIYKAKLIYWNKISHTQLLKLRNQNNYTKIKSIMFDYNYLHNTLKDKEKIISLKWFWDNFFGVTEEGVNLKF